MVLFIVIFGFLLIIYCLISLIAPTLIRKTIDIISVGSRLYLGGALRIIIGIMLLALAPQTRLWGYVLVVGLIAATSGVCVYFFALRRTKKILKRLQSQPNSSLRLYAAIAIVIWAILFYALLPIVLAH